VGTTRVAHGRNGRHCLSWATVLNVFGL